MFYEYVCDECQEARVLQASMAEGPPAQVLCSPPCEATMRRLYTGQSAPAIIQWDSQTYMERAYEGREEVANMPTRQVRAILDSYGRDAMRGKRNNHDYGDRKRTQR